MTAPIPEALRRLGREVQRAGGRAFLVGGCVRDRLLQRRVKDWDVEVYGVAEDDLERLLQGLGRVNAVGRAFGVLKLRMGRLDVDVSLPRLDSKVGPGHRGIAVQGDPSLGFDEACRRRDLTVNALLHDLVTDELVDRVGGLEDLRARRLRAVDRHTFLEDPLRALRVVQFAARLDFEPDEELLELCAEAALDELPAERIGEEWRKLLLGGVAPSRGLRVAVQTGIHQRLFPGIEPPAEGVLERLLPERDVREPGRAWALMLCAWGLGASPSSLESALDRLAVFRWLGVPVRELVLAAIAAREAPSASDTDLRRLAAVASAELVLLARWAHTQDSALQRAVARARELGVHEVALPRVLQGRHLAGRVPGGPAMGELLRAAYEAQLAGAFSDEEGGLAWLNEALSRRG